MALTDVFNRIRDTMSNIPKENIDGSNTTFTLKSDKTEVDKGQKYTISWQCYKNTDARSRITGIKITNKGATGIGAYFISKTKTNSGAYNEIFEGNKEYTQSLNDREDTDRTITAEAIDNNGNVLVKRSINIKATHKSAALSKDEIYLNVATEANVYDKIPIEWGLDNNKTSISDSYKVRLLLGDTVIADNLNTSGGSYTSPELKESTTVKVEYYSGSNVISKSANITVKGAIVSENNINISANPASIKKGESSTITWGYDGKLPEITKAELFITGEQKQAVQNSGSKTINNINKETLAKITYIYPGGGALGSESISKEIKISVDRGGSDVFTMTATANGQTRTLADLSKDETAQVLDIKSGDNVSITVSRNNWDITSSNFDATNDNIPNGGSKTFTLQPFENIEYTISGTDDNGNTRNKKIIVNVNKVSAGEPTLKLELENGGTSISINRGQSVNIKYQINDYYVTGTNILGINKTYAKNIDNTTSLYPNASTEYYISAKKTKDGNEERKSIVVNINEMPQIQPEAQTNVEEPVSNEQIQTATSDTTSFNEGDKTVTATEPTEFNQWMTDVNKPQSASRIESSYTDIISGKSPLIKENQRVDTDINNYNNQITTLNNEITSITQYINSVLIPKREELLSIYNRSIGTSNEQPAKTELDKQVLLIESYYSKIEDKRNKISEYQKQIETMNAGRIETENKFKERMDKLKFNRERALSDINKTNTSVRMVGIRGTSTPNIQNGNLTYETNVNGNMQETKSNLAGALTSTRPVYKWADGTYHYEPENNKSKISGNQLLGGLS